MGNIISFAKSKTTFKMNSLTLQHEIGFDIAIKQHQTLPTILLIYYLGFLFYAATSEGSILSGVIPFRFCASFFIFFHSLKIWHSKMEPIAFDEHNG